MSVGEADLRAIFAALHFRDPVIAPLQAIPESRWHQVLAMTDRAQLTLALGLRARDALPNSVQNRIDNNLRNNSIRHQRLLEAHREIAAALGEAGIPFVLLKGISNWPGYCERPEHRPQSDIDILCSPELCGKASAVVRQLGWTPVESTYTAGADHLPIMIRKTGWTWKGDYYDPDMPHALEIHFRLWDSTRERIAVEDLAGLVSSATPRDLSGLKIRTLRPCDGLTYACLHLVRHLLRGALIPRHVYEIAHFLEHFAQDDDFWQTWDQSQALTPRRKLLAAVAFRLAIGWFGCNAHPIAASAAANLPRPVSRWFRLFMWSPAVSLVRPNKDELWLHLALVDSGASQLRIAVSRILPLHLPKAVLDAHVPSQQVGIALRIRRFAYTVSFGARRMLHHTRATLPVIASGLRYWRSRAGAA